MQLKFLKSDSIEELKNNIAENFNCGNYNKKNSWIKEVLKSGFEGDTKINLLDLDLIPSDKSIDELENCKKYISL
ncbi:hypothetical protein F1B95_05420 [Clostridium perfringens]|nr:hypothetical protein F1B95_05420 [Clostridium perfringens]